jgi:hypothetical protein
MTNDEAWTCGKGLAAGADLPKHLGRLLAARAEVLERHTRALDGNDPNGRREHEAYMDLVGRHRALAVSLAALAEQMQSYRNLPMAEHNMEVMMDPNGQMEAFAEFVAIERDFLAFLQSKLRDDESLLASDH